MRLLVTHKIFRASQPRVICAEYHQPEPRRAPKFQRENVLRAWELAIDKGKSFVYNRIGTLSALDKIVVQVLNDDEDTIASVDGIELAKEFDMTSMILATYNIEDIHKD